MSNFIYVLPTSSRIATLLAAKAQKNYEAKTLDLFFDIPKDTFLVGSHNSEDALTYMIPLGFKTYAPPGADMFLLPRSSSGNLRKLNPTIMDPPYIERLKAANIDVFDTDALTLANTIGYIDWDYRNEWKALVRTVRDITIDNDRAYLQAIPLEPSKYVFKIVDEISQIPEEYLSTQRGEKGFGSSG
jgi:dUTPase